MQKLTDFSRTNTARDAAPTASARRVMLTPAVVALAAFALTLVIEAGFKFPILAADGFILDDFFFIERAIHHRPFSTIAEFVPVLEGIDFDRSSFLTLYRWLVVLTGDLETLQWLHLLAVCLASAFFAAALMHVTGDPVLSVSASVLSFITPFSFIIAIFVNGSYNALCFVFVFAAVLIGAHADFRTMDRRAIARFASITALLLSAIAIVYSGVAFSMVALGWIFLRSGARRSRVACWLFAAGAAVMAVSGAVALGLVEHPYARFEGRITYDVATALLNGLSILRNMVVSYLDPMITTGQLTLAPNLFPAFAAIALVLVVFGIGAYRNRRLAALSETKRETLLFIGFLSVSLAASVAPFLALTRTHIWHYFPHMVFFVSVCALALHAFVGRWFAYAALLLVGALTISTYAEQRPAYQVSMRKQVEIVAFVRANASDWRGADEVYVLTDQSYLVSGVGGGFRSTAFARYLTGDPDHPFFGIARDIPQVIEQLTQAAATRRVQAYRMEDSEAVSVPLPQPGEE